LFSAADAACNPRQDGPDPLKGWHTVSKSICPATNALTLFLPLVEIACEDLDRGAEIVDAEPQPADGERWPFDEFFTTDDVYALIHTLRFFAGTLATIDGAKLDRHLVEQLRQHAPHRMAGDRERSGDASRRAFAAKVERLAWPQQRGLLYVGRGLDALDVYLDHADSVAGYVAQHCLLWLHPLLGGCITESRYDDTALDALVNTWLAYRPDDDPELRGLMAVAA
jgi:hypothetical protein